MLSTPPIPNQNRRAKNDFDNFNGPVLYRERPGTGKPASSAPSIGELPISKNPQMTQIAQII